MESEREGGGGREGERQRSVIFNYNCNHICNDLTDNNREANEKCNQCCGYGVGVSGVFLMRQIFVIIIIVITLRGRWTVRELCTSYELRLISIIPLESIWGQFYKA